MMEPGEFGRAVNEDKETMNTLEFLSGLSRGRKFCRDIGKRFGTCVPVPKNPHNRGTDAFREWKSGYDTAIAEWFR